MDKIEKVIYINLAHRTDRRAQIENELSVFPSERVIRFDAIYEKERGHLGCSKSHIAVLEMAIREGWNNYLVIEDDMVWDKFESGCQILRNLFDKNPDVIVLGGTSISFYDTHRLSKCYCTTAYLVFNHYYGALLSNFKEGASLLENNYKHNTPYAIDQYWHRLQQRDNWYIVYPIICLQRAGYSDINQQKQELKTADYRPKPRTFLDILRGKK
jgi:glycosyl transferase family 25